MHDDLSDISSTDKSDEYDEAMRLIFLEKSILKMFFSKYTFWRCFCFLKKYFLREQFWECIFLKEHFLECNLKNEFFSENKFENGFLRE